MFKKGALNYALLTRFGRIISLILFGCIVVTYFFIGSNLFLVKKIEILNSKLIDEKSLSRWKGKNIFLVPVDILRAKAEEIPEVKSVIIRKELPNKLTVAIQEYMPCALLRENIKLAVSKEGVVFPFKEAATKSYPLVIYEKEDSPVGKQWPGLEKAMKAYLAIKDTVPIEVIKVKSNNEIFLYTQITKTEIRIDSEEYEKETDYLKVLMKELPSKNVEYIDLRFGRDIVVKP